MRSSSKLATVASSTVSGTRKVVSIVVVYAKGFAIQAPSINQILIITLPSIPCLFCFFHSHL